MTDQPTISARRPWPLFLPLLPLLPLWHSHNALLGFIGPAISIRFLLYAGAWILLLWLGARLLAGSFYAAAGLAFFPSLVFLFYGPTYDLLEKGLPARTLSFKILPLLLFGGSLLASYLLLRTEARRGRPYRFLNLLLPVLLLVEAVTTVVQLAQKPRPLFEGILPVSASPCGSAPDLYLVVQDEYARADVLARMGFDNRPFLDSLRGMGFYVADSSRANYNFTPFALASAFNGRYLHGAAGSRGDDPALTLRAVRSVTESDLFRYLGKAGYSLHFFASLEHAQQQRPVLNEFGNYPQHLLFEGLFTFRLKEALQLRPDPIVRLLPQPIAYNNVVQRAADMQAHLDESLRLVDSSAQRPPRLVYTHLLTTHLPYLFDSAGGMLPPFRALADKSTGAYINQVRAANRQVLELVHAIRRGGRANSVIVVLSDHGYRQDPQHPEDGFRNIEAVYYPDGRYQSLYPGISPVNLFRVLLNDRYCQQLPLLPDSSVSVRYE
ncbi:MAG: hypothetical protein EOO16_02930 [Chitinophagaceae bacterium]|nr:MAG: hypothetical protein EOO16_02930 [Chitinophagaceae bacterium]